jgi:two-component system LytT family sensor kinase
MKPDLPFNYSLRKVFPIILVSGILISLFYLLTFNLFQTSGALAYIAHGIIITSGLWIGCMSIVQFLWTKFPWEHNPYKHLAFEIISITIYTLLFSYGLYLIEIRIGLDHPVNNPTGEIAVTLLITYFISAIHEAVYFYRQWKYNFSQSVRLEKANIEANFETLKAQVNPHFIFNSLNSLSSMVDDNPSAVAYIQNLSGFLRYLLNTNEKELVNLNDEMAIVNSYIDLLKSRFGENLKLHARIPENMNLHLVPPLSVQMLVENCIKHNIISNDKPLEISIYTEGDFLLVENKIQAKMDVQKSGHGLKNIIERYSYFSERKTEIVETPDHFKVKIPLLTKEI